MPKSIFKSVSHAVFFLTFGFTSWAQANCADDFSPTTLKAFHQNFQQYPFEVLPARPEVGFVRSDFEGLAGQKTVYFLKNNETGNLEVIEGVHIPLFKKKIFIGIRVLDRKSGTYTTIQDVKQIQSVRTSKAWRKNMAKFMPESSIVDTEGDPNRKLSLYQWYFARYENWISVDATNYRPVRYNLENQRIAALIHDGENYQIYEGIVLPWSSSENIELPSYQWASVNNVQIKRDDGTILPLLQMDPPFEVRVMPTKIPSRN
jgi:hypothetical protein